MKKLKEEKFEIDLPEVFNLGLMLDCGQAFRWKKEADGSMRGIVGDRVFSLLQKDGKLICSCSREEFNGVLRRYLDFDRDYKALVNIFSADKYLKKATREFSGIRILRQQPWETLCSFIISQNNNIPSIKGIIERLCQSFGEEIEEGCFSFPEAERLKNLKIEDLAVLRSGFRAKYILDAAEKVADGEVDFDKIESSPIETGREELIKIKGVGKKVAECTLLYGFGKLEAFPEDVWVKRIVSEMYPDGLPECIKGYDGVAQQYLFHWRRNGKEFG